jgi:transposase InsO family protein
MFDTLWGTVVWGSGNGKSQMLKDCGTVYHRCSSCAANKTLPRNPARLRRTKARRPFLRMQVDLYEVSPEAPDGTKQVLTMHCTYSRYPFFRRLKGKGAREVAVAIFDVILDAGVVPQIIQSDLGREFVNSLISELLVLLGAHQVFSSAVHPQSQGIVERPHRDMSALLSILINSLVEARPENWPDHLRTLECRCRDKVIGRSGCTPRGLVNGWFNVTSLQSALALVEEIPPDLPHDEFVRELIKDHQDLAQRWDEWRADEEAKEEAYYNEKQVRGHQVKVGDLVMLAKGETERRAGGKLPPKADGPFEVASKPNEHTVTLKRPQTGEPVLGGRPMPASRIILFRFPKELMQPVGAEERAEAEEGLTRMREAEAALLQVNDVVCYETSLADGTGAALLIVDAVHGEQKAVSGRKLRAVGQGPWKERVWQVDAGAEALERGQVGFADLLCRVELENSKLSGGSVEAMRNSGVVL